MKTLLSWALIPYIFFAVFYAILVTYWAYNDYFVEKYLLTPISLKEMALIILFIKLPFVKIKKIDTREKNIEIFKQVTNQLIVTGLLYLTFVFIVKFL